MIGRWTKVRIGLCAAVLAAIGVKVVATAARVQIAEAPELKALAEQNYVKQIEIRPRRGRILDRHGNELASTVDADSIACNPKVLRHVPNAARKLARALGMDAREIQKILARDSYFAYLKRTVSSEVSQAVQALGLKGVEIRKEPTRAYPNDALGATVLGHTDRDGNGIEGLEKRFDEALRGQKVRFMAVRDMKGRELMVQGTVDPKKAAGSDLVLTLDKRIMHITERALAGAVERHRAKGGTAIVMDPRTGDILAIANSPTYDPLRPGDAIARGARNRAVTDPYEPGSTMKTFAFAGALERGLNPGSWWDCQLGRMQIGKHVIRDDHGKGTITATEVFMHSSNIGTVKIARSFGGKQGLYDTLVKFGFGRRTRVGLPGEQAGLLYPPKKWGEIEFATNAYGQGMTVTPLQLVTAFAAIAAGGVYRPPRLVTKIVHSDGREEAVTPPPGARGEERIMKPQAARALIEIMKAPIEGGTGKKAAVDGYAVAGKTGTPLKVVDGKYDYKKYFPSFVGFVPADDPRLAILVAIDEPAPDAQGKHYGGAVAAPVFKEIAEEALRYLGVPPSPALLAALKQKEAKAAALAGKAPAPIEDLREGFGHGNPPVDLLPPAEEGLAIEDADPGPKVPDFRGMTLVAAIRAARQAGLELEPEGSGIAVAQTPAPGSRVEGPCRVTFRPGG